MSMLSDLGARVRRRRSKAVRGASDAVKARRERTARPESAPPKDDERYKGFRGAVVGSDVDGDVFGGAGCQPGEKVVWEGTMTEAGRRYGGW